ncbi:hypothetical protein O3M35_008921 [Rhynocoris fuscipes]|uniref:Odorant receptor n=1 Tax=Rhynocoris fuscipes TaxID=488301 RepID=A0AAW1DD78_9HEMI
MHELWRNLAGTILTCLACYTALTIYTAFSSFLIAFSFQISAYSKMLQNRLETNGPQDKTIYRHHQTIIKLVEEFNDLFSIQICIEVLVASLEPCGYGYAMMKSVKKYDLGTLDLFYKMFMVLAAPFALCYCGQVISNQMEKLHDSCYMTNWYEEKPKIRRDLLTMMMVTTKPKTLNYRMIVTFNLQYFFTVRSKY